MAALFPLFVCGACAPPADDVEPAVAPKSVAFAGSVDTRFIGVWRSADGGSTLDLGKDGGLKLTQTTRSQNGATTSSFEGRWLADAGKLRLRYADAAKQETTIEYAATFAKGALVLGQPGGRVKTTYRRSP